MSLLFFYHIPLPPCRIVSCFSTCPLLASTIEVVRNRALEKVEFITRLDFRSLCFHKLSSISSTSSRTSPFFHLSVRHYFFYTRPAYINAATERVETASEKDKSRRTNNKTVGRVLVEQAKHRLWRIGLDGNRGCFVETISTPGPGLIVRGMISSLHRDAAGLHDSSPRNPPLVRPCCRWKSKISTHQRANVKPSVTSRASVPPLLVCIQVVKIKRARQN